MRVGRPDDAESDLKSWSGGQLTPYIGLEAARLNGLAMLALHRDVDRARALARQANALATRQGAGLQERIARMLVAICGPEAQMSAAVSDMYVRDPAILSALAEHVAGRLDELGAAAAEAVRAEACRRPERWRHALRQVLDGSPTSEKLIPAALLLEEIGDATDVMRLRGLARALRSRRHAAIGRKLIRRVAAKVFVEDLGRVRIRVGDRAVHSRAVRRKVLALLAYLVARPDLSATSDQVIEALWPDADPDDAGNSLNQTVYFLRRLIEPAYREDTSPGFVHHRSDLIWLDSELVDSQSRRCGRLLRDFAATRDPALVEELSQQYTARFALDFEYEDWADAYRDALHTSFLEVVERQVRADVETGEFDRGIGLARAVLSVDPDAATVEGSLIRLYGLAGAHAAAAEQQEHYAGHADDDERTWSDR
jgi:DNA-binding SARP family transcriptional activator